MDAEILSQTAAGINTLCLCSPVVL